jgi:arylsulfatase A-like enzyme
MARILHSALVCALASGSISCSVPSVSVREAGDRPNFVLVFIDDMGYGDIGAFGSTTNRTPRIDAMAEEGMKLTSFYAHPVCTPSRAALMTGCYPMRNGLQTGFWHPVLMPGDPQGIHPDETTVAEVLRQRGYATGIVGKWHLGDQPDFLPTNHGFDYYFGLPYSNDMSPYMPLNARNHPPLPLLRNLEVIREVPEDQSFLTRDYTVEALSFIDRHKDQPFLLYIPHSMVHVPLWAGEEFQGTSSNGILGDCIEELDWSVGEIRRKLEEHRVAENTLVFFTSDNGPARGSAGPLRGRKGSTYEGGVRVPTVAYWPGTIPPGSSYVDTATTMDILPTFAALAGAETSAARIDGHDISAILKGDTAQASPYRAFYYYRGYELRAVRSGKWKLHVDGTLYNLEADVAESRDEANANPEVKAQLAALLEQGRETIGDGPVWPIDPGISLPPTARPIGKIEREPRLLIPRHGTTGQQAHQPPVRTKTANVEAPPGYQRPENW